MDQKSPSQNGHKSLSPLWMIGSCIIGGGMIGAVTNAINGYISPSYFRAVLGWDFQGIMAAAIAQGILEGLLYGLFVGIILGITLLIVTKRQSTIVPTLLKNIVGIILICWIVAGLVAMGLATLSPNFYKHAFKGVPDEYWPMMGYAWVGGSIWGAMIGGVLGTMMGVFSIRSTNGGTTASA